MPPKLPPGISFEFGKQQLSDVPPATLEAWREVTNANLKLRAEVLTFQESTAKITTKMENLYDRVGALEAEKEDDKKLQAELRKAKDELSNELRDVKTELESRGKEIASQRSDIASLHKQLDKNRNDIEQQSLLNSHQEDLLQKAYADANELRDERNAARAERDIAETKHRDSELRLQELHSEWTENQKKLQELETIHSDLLEIQKHTKFLDEEISDLTAQGAEKDRLIRVKDARITNLEEKVQNALTTAARAEAAAQAATSPTAEPQTIVSAEPDLQAELEALGDDGQFDRESDYEEQQLDFSGIIAHAIIDITPIEPSTVSQSVQTEMPLLRPSSLTTVDITPISPVTTTASVQTDTPVLAISGVTTTVDRTPIAPQRTILTQAETPALTVSGVTTLDITPIDTQTTQPTTATTAFTQTDTVTETPVIPPVVYKKSFGFWPYITAVLVLLFAMTWFELQAWKSANTYYENNAGAFGNPVHFLGFIPMGWDIGNSRFSEAIARQTAIMLQGLESWTGADRAIMY